MANYGIAYLRRKLAGKRVRVKKRYEYYDMKNLMRDFDISTPPQFKSWQGSIRWCTRAVDALAMRLRFRNFANDSFDLNGIYALNNRDILFRSAILSALIGSCSFLYISEDETGYPRLQVIDGGSATGILDPVTNLLTEGYAVLDWSGQYLLGEWTPSGGTVSPAGDSSGTPGSIPFREAYFTKDYTFILENGRLVQAIPNKAPYALLVPVIFQPDAARPFGHSRISRACMDITEEALRTLKRAEVSAEYYSFPQKYILGIDPGTEFIGSRQAGPHAGQDPSHSRGPLGPSYGGSSGLYGAGQYAGQSGQSGGDNAGTVCGTGGSNGTGCAYGTGTYGTGGAFGTAGGTFGAQDGQQGISEADRRRMSMASMLLIGPGEGQQVPKAGQFTQQSMEPHASMLKMLAGQFAQASDLTLDDMGFPTDNPSSAEAIKSAHENLRLTALDAQTTFGTGFLNAGYLAACVRDNFPYTRQQLYKTIPKWEPVFTPDSSMLAGIGDAVGKINTAVPGYFGAENLRDLTGIDPGGNGE